MLKKVLVSTILCFMLVTLFGCTTIDASVRVLRNGQVEQKVDIIFDKDKVAAAGYGDFTAFLATVKGIVQTHVNNKETNYDTHLSNLPINNIDDLRVYNILSSSNPAKIEFFANGFRITKQFNNVYAFMFYNYYDEFTEQLEFKRLVDVPLAEDGSLEIDEEMFIANYVEKCYTLYYGQEGFIQEIADAISLQTGVNIQLSEAELIFRFITPYKRLHSDGTTTFNGENYVHTWNISNPNNTITLYRTTSRPAYWYVLALGLGLLTIAIGLIYYKLRKPNPRSAQEITHMAEDINNINMMNYNNDKTAQTIEIDDDTNNNRS